MFKKYFIFLFIFASFVFLNNRASAASYLVKEPGSNTCTSKLINATATNIISAVDLNIPIDVCVVTGSNPPFVVNETSPRRLEDTKTINSSLGTTTVTMNYSLSTTTDTVTGAGSISIKNNEKINFDIFDNNANNDHAEINAYMDITPITLSNDQGLADYGTLGAGKTIVFTCTNSTELYYDPVANATNTPIVSDYTGGTGYKLVYSVTPTPGSHIIECDNIDGSLTRQVFHLTAQNFKLDINNTSYTPTVAMSPVHFTWSSNGTNCSFYNFDKSVKFGNATGNSTSGFAYDLVSPNFPSGANSYGYYIKCYDSVHPGTAINELNANLSSTTESVAGVNTTIAWYHLIASFTCPTGYTADGANGNVCVTTANPPVCSFTDTSATSISCTCPGGTVSALTVNNTDGSSQSIVPPTSSFAWSNLQYRYQISCNGGTSILYSALQRPYTHFLSFNVSAGYIKPGGLIDMNWVVQDPTTTCKIIGVDLKTGAEIFNSTSGNYSAINNSVTVSKSSSATQNFSTGSFKALMNASFTVNNSARFTASCQNGATSTDYMFGYYKLVRDVYTTTSQER